VKVKYIGESYGVGSLTNNKEYECLGIEGSFLKIIDDSEEDYLYPINNPGSLNGKNGKWMIVEDDDAGSLHEVIHGYMEAVLS
jgi:hypothetical protein